jgi:tetratricopeptide (TPR) repeat protein
MPTISLPRWTPRDSAFAPLFSGSFTILDIRAFQLVALLLLTSSFPSCVTTEADRQALQKGFDAYSNRRLDEAEAAATAFINANPDSPNIDEAYYLRGLSRLTRGNNGTPSAAPARAVTGGGPAGSAGGAGGVAGEGGGRAAAADDLRLAIAKSSRPDLKAKATRVLARIEGDTHVDATRWKEAKDAYLQALPGASPAEATYFNYRIGAAFQCMGEFDAARPYLQEVIAANSDPYLTERSISRLRASDFTLQFGAFHEAPRAAELRAQLRASNIPADVLTDTRDGKLIYIIRSGSYKTWQQADAARDQYQSKYPLVSIVP